MQAILLSINAWERIMALNPNGLQLSLGDVIVVACEHGLELGKIIEFQELSEDQLKETPIGNIVERAASAEDFSNNNAGNKDKEAIMEYCHRAIKKHGLEMKLVDVHASLDGQRLTFAFIADGRIDFRELVKDLSRHYQKNIRLHQLGVRDEAKITGDIGCCGLTQCCIGHLKKLGNVTSEFAEHQQVVHRGSERLSGVCGRLKCCLAYEESYYQELIEKLPPIGTRVRTKHGRGEVIGWHVLRGSVNVRLDPEKEGDKPIIVEIPIINKEVEAEK